MGSIFSQTPPSPYPRTLLIQAQIQFNGMTNYSGIINRMDVGIYKSYDDTSTDFIETFRNIRVANGYFTIILGSTKPLYGHYFSDDSVRIGFTRI